METAPIPNQLDSSYAQQMPPIQDETSISQFPEQFLTQGWEIPADVDTSRQANAYEYTQKQQMEAKVEQAVENCSFYRSPELVEGLKGFYETHYQADTLIKQVVSGEAPNDETAKAAEIEALEAVVAGGTLSKEAVENLTSSLINYGNQAPDYIQAALPVLASVRIARLKDPDSLQLQRAELMAASRANESLFAESSVGVTTVTAEDKQKVVDNQAAINARIEGSGFFGDRDEIIGLSSRTHSWRNDAVLKDPLYNINRAEGIFWDDVRFAGQLLFHNTSSFKEVYEDNAVMTRRMQLAADGKFNTPNATYKDGRLHSPTPHWSEEFDFHNYRGKNIARGDHPGTIAIPLAEIIKTAPYGRNSQYGTLSIKSNQIERLLPRITIHDTTADIGSGSADRQGKYSTDRTFYCSPKDVTPEAPLEQAPDGYAIPLRETSTWVQLGDEVAKSGITYGIGQHLPNQVVIPVGEYFSGSSDLDVIKQHTEQYKATIAESIADLQHKSIAKYGTQLVIALRSGVIDFAIADDGPANLGQPYAKFVEVPEAISRKAPFFLDKPLV